MNTEALLRRVYPLPLRIKCHSILRRFGWTPQLRGASSLAFAPVSLSALIPGDAIHDHILATGVYDLELSRFFSALAVKTGGLMIDAGANIGYFTVLWASLNKANRVLAFEPSPRNVAMLKENISSAGVADRATVHAMALGRESGEMQFETGPRDQTGWGMLARQNNAENIRVPVARLDDLVPPGERVAILKSDCQGADTWVLEGAAGLLAAKRISHVFYEACPPLLKKLGIDPGAAADLLKRYGYRVEPFGHPDDEMMHAWIDKPA